MAVTQFSNSRPHLFGAFSWILHFIYDDISNRCLLGPSFWQHQSGIKHRCVLSRFHPMYIHYHCLLSIGKAKNDIFLDWYSTRSCSYSYGYQSFEQGGDWYHTNQLSNAQSYNPLRQDRVDHLLMQSW